MPAAAASTFLTPSQARLGVNPVLTEFITGYMSQTDNFVWNRLCPTVNVTQRGGTVIRFDKRAFKLYNTLRAPGTQTARVSVGYASDPYATINTALDAIVEDENREEAATVAGLDLAKEAVQLVSDAINLILEKEVADLALNSQSYPATNRTVVTGTSRWTDAASRPLDQIIDWREQVRRTIGVKPNVLILPPGPANALKKNAQVRDTVILGNRPESDYIVTLDKLSMAVEMMVYEATAVFSGDDETQPFTNVWGNTDVVLAYVPQAGASKRRPSFGYTYTLQGHPQVINPYRDDSARCDVYGVNYERRPVLTSLDAGFLAQTVVAA